MPVVMRMPLMVRHAGMPGVLAAELCNAIEWAHLGGRYAPQLRGACNQHRRGGIEQQHADSGP